MDVIVASQKMMLKDLNKAGLTASGGQCLWEDLYREFQRQGRPACGSSVCARHCEGRGAGALEKRSPRWRRSVITTAMNGRTNTN